MKAVILAGGSGSRMYPFSELIPKCLLPVAGIPCVYRIAKRMLDHGYTDIILCINKWMETQFKFVFRDLPVKFSVSPKPLGTAGEIHYAWKKGLIGNEKFLIQFGDDLTEIKYEEAIKFHESEKGDATLATTTNVLLDVGVIELDADGRLLKFMEKPMLGKPSWTSVAILEPVVLSYLKPGLDMGRNIFPKMLEDGKRILVYQTDADWIDIGSIAHFQRANEMFRKAV